MTKRRRRGRGQRRGQRWAKNYVRHNRVTMGLGFWYCLSNLELGAWKDPDTVRRIAGVLK